MAQSLARIHIHLIFSTKHRAPLLRDDIREDVHKYMAGIFRKQDSPATLINSVEDHVHVLFELARTKALCDVIEEAKKSSSKEIKTYGAAYAEFA